MYFEDAKKEAKVSKIPNNVNITRVSEPNIDTLTYSKAVTTNNQLSTVLKAKQALEFGKYFTFVNAALKPSDVKKNDNFDDLLFTNRKILAVLKKIEENMIDEQDTSIKHNSNDSKNQTATKNGITQNAHDENNSGLGLDLPLIPGKGKKAPAYKRGKYKKHPKDKNGKKPKVKPKKTPLKEVEPHKKPFNELSKKEQLKEAKAHSQSTKFTELPKEERRVLAEQRAKEIKLNNIKRSFIPKTARVLARGASLVGTGIVIGEGVYQYVNAECAGDRMDAVGSTIGALGGAWAGAKIGAIAGAWAGPIGIAAGALIGAGVGALAGSVLGEWISGKLKTPLDLIPDKFKNRGPQVEYAYIETHLLPYINNLTYESEAEYNEDFKTVEDRMIELVEEMKKAPTEEQQKEWDKNKLVNDDIVTDNLLFDNYIKDWKKVENLSDSDLDILINDADLSEIDRDRVREMKFMRNAKTNTQAQTAVSAIDRVNQAIEAEKKRLEEYRKESTYDSFSGAEIYSNNYRRSLKTIEELKQVKKTMLSQAERGDFKSIEVDEKSRDINNNSVKQFNSLTLQNTSSAEFFASKNLNADEFATQWATSYSSHKDISKNAIADFSSIKAKDIQFNKNDHLGFVSGEFESGGNPGVIAKDNIGYAYGAWQMNSQVGALRAFVKDIKNDERFARLAELKIDSPEFQNEWARVAKAYPSEFLEKQHEFIEKTKFKPVLEYARSAGLNTTNRAVQEALWSQAVQHGFEGNKKIIDAAVKKVGKSSSPDDIVRALYESRADYINGLSTLSDSLKAQINDRYRRESSKALGIVSNEEFQNSEITKSVNSDSDVPLTNEESKSEITKSVNSDSDVSEIKSNEESKSEITKSVNSDTSSDLPQIKLKKESNSENTKNGTETQKSNKDEKLATDISKIEKVQVEEMPIEDLNQNITIVQVVNKEESVTPPKSSNDDADLTEWTVQPPI